MYYAIVSTFVLIFGYICGQSVAFHFFNLTEYSHTAACMDGMHCHPVADKAFQILLDNEDTVEPCIAVSVNKGTEATIFATFPTKEGGKTAKALSRYHHHGDSFMNSIFRRRASAYGRFMDDVASHKALNYNFTFLTVLRDDCTLKKRTSEALFHAGYFFGTFSHRGPYDESHILSVPDHRYIDTRGFQKMLQMLDNWSIPFTEKIPALFWRGTSSGSKVSCKEILRVRMALLLKNTKSANFKISNPKTCHLNQSVMDFDEEGIFGEYAPEAEWIKYRAIVDVDGNFATNGLPWRVQSGSTLFRVITNNFGWIENVLKPFVHYFPINGNLSNLLDAADLAASSNPETVAELKKVAHNGKQLRQRLSYDEVVYNFVHDVNKFVERRHEEIKSRRKVVDIK